MVISEVLKKARSATELSQEAAAEKVGVSRQTLSNWETGKSYPDIVSVIALSDAYGVSLDSLMKGDADMIKHLEESTNVTKSNKQKAASIIASLLAIGGTVLIILVFGGEFGDFVDIPSWVAIIIPILAVLTVTRSFKLFGIGFKAAFLPKKDVDSSVREQAASLFKLLSKTAILSGVIMTMISVMNMFLGINFVDENFFPNFMINLAVSLVTLLYSLFLIVFIFEPIVYILRRDNI